MGGNALPYYRDTSNERKLLCSVKGVISVRSSLVVTQFGDILRTIELPLKWRQEISERCKGAEATEDSESKRIQQRRGELEAEQKRLLTLFTKGYITEEELDEQMGLIQTNLFSLPVLLTPDTQEVVQEALSMGETLEHIADYWNEAMPEERRDMVWSLLKVEGLIYDIERQAIIGLLPRDSVLPVLAIGLEATEMWEQHDGGLWLREKYWPPVQVSLHLPPPQKPGLTPSQQERAIMLIRQGMSLRQVAELFDTSYQTIHRLVKRVKQLSEHSE